jgi:hypothetical protein
MNEQLDMMNKPPQIMDEKALENNDNEEISTELQSTEQSQIQEEIQEEEEMESKEKEESTTKKSKISAKKSGPVRKSKKGGWSEEEDEILKKSVAEHNGSKYLLLL